MKRSMRPRGVSHQGVIKAAGLYMGSLWQAVVCRMDRLAGDAQYWNCPWGKFNSIRGEEMFAHKHGESRPTEYSMIVEPHPRGAVIGYLAGKPINEEIVDLFGRRFRFVGVASFRRDGDVDASGLGVGEFIAEPGLIYRLIGSNSDRPAPARQAA